MDKKSRDILKAIVAGHTCEQVLEGDGTLTHHDVFHALTETPTSYWKKIPARGACKGCPDCAAAVRTPARHRAD